MLKRGLLFLLVFIIFLQNSLAQECLLPSEENVPQYAQNLIQIFSSPNLHLKLNPEQAALDSLDRWTNDEGSGWLAYKEQIRNSIQDGAGECMDDYSFRTKDDCWDNGLCVEGNGCVGFEDMGWNEEVLENVMKIKSPIPSVREEGLRELANSHSLEAVPAIIKVLETDTNKGGYAASALSLLISSPKAVSALIKAIETNPDEYVRISALLGLATRDYPEKIPLLIKTMETNTYEGVRRFAAEELLRIGSPEAVLAVIRVLNVDGHSVSKMEITDLLVRTNSQEIFSVLRVEIKTNPNVDVRRKIIEVLRKNGSSEAVSILIMALNDPNTDSNTDVRGAAALSLGQIGSSEAVQALIKALEEDSDAYVRGAVAISLGQILSSEAVQALIKALEEDSDADVRVTAALSLGQILSSEQISSGQILSSEAVQALIRALEEDSDADVRITIRDVLAKVSPVSTLKLLREEPLFEKIYTNQRLSHFPTIEKNSISISVYRFLNRETKITEDEIDMVIDLILSKRSIFKNEIILGKNTYFIVFNHEDPRMMPEPINKFARERGVRRMGGTLKGPIAKQEIIDVIVNSRNNGETTIWANAHGLPNYVCLGGGIPNQANDISEKSCFGFRYDEYADVLLQRGNLNEVILIIDSCFSYDFAVNLLNSLEEKNSINFPTIITVSNQGRLSYLNIFINSLNSLNLQEGEPLLGRHIYEAEEFSFEIQDSAVFFSEGGTSLPLEIAMNSLNPSECGCTGTSCPIEPTQGTPS